VTAQTPYRQVRAVFTDRTVRVYQAYSPRIADPAIRGGKFVPPFKRERATWIKPSFSWMMYRSGWGRKLDQERVLGIDILRSGFEWALANSCLSHYDPALHASHDGWKHQLSESPVRIQWDPERTICLDELPWRSIQIGLAGAAVGRYVDEWIVGIKDVTPLARRVERACADGDIARAQQLAPQEIAYPIPMGIIERIGATR
jgi:hypothetical protein